MDTFKEIKIGVDYRIDGKILDSMPADLNTLAAVEVVYETLPGWELDISGVRKFEDLPVNARNYVRRIEELMGVDVEWVGVGPARDAMLKVTSLKRKDFDGKH